MIWLQTCSIKNNCDICNIKRCILLYVAISKKQWCQGGVPGGTVGVRPGGGCGVTLWSIDRRYYQFLLFGPREKQRIRILHRWVRSTGSRREVSNDHLANSENCFPLSNIFRARTQCSGGGGTLIITWAVENRWRRSTNENTALSPAPWLATLIQRSRDSPSSPPVGIEPSSLFWVKVWVVISVTLLGVTPGLDMSDMENRLTIT